MTKEEKVKTRMLVEEAKKRSRELREDTELDNDSKNWIFLVRGPPWKQRIMKVRPRQPLF